MNDLVYLGEIIRERRLSLNLRSEELANKAHISRATLSSIENGKGNYSINTLLEICQILDLGFDLENKSDLRYQRKRASKQNLALIRKTNRFIIMTVEQYAKHLNKDSQSTYQSLKDVGLIKELKEDYEDLHGMSTEYLNYYFDGVIKNNKK